MTGCLEIAPLALLRAVGSPPALLFCVDFPQVPGGGDARDYLNGLVSASVVLTENQVRQQRRNPSKIAVTVVRCHARTGSCYLRTITAVVKTIK